MQQLTDVIQRHIIDALADTHTSTIGRVTKVNTTTLELESVTRMTYKGEDIPLIAFSQVPPVFMQGGASYTAHPVAVGDYALIVFAERAFDRWYSGVDGVRPPELRMHDYSDGFALVGINPELSAITIPSVITHIGDTYQEGSYEHLGDRTQTGNQTVNGNIIINGNLTVNGDIGCTGKLTVASASIGGIDFATHVHPQGSDSAGNTEQDTGAAK